MVYLAMEAGYTEKVDELCERYSLEGFVKVTGWIEMRPSNREITQGEYSTAKGEGKGACSGWVSYCEQVCGSARPGEARGGCQRDQCCCTIMDSKMIHVLIVEGETVCQQICGEAPIIPSVTSEPSKLSLVCDQASVAALSTANSIADQACTLEVNAAAAPTMGPCDEHATIFCWMSRLMLLWEDSGVIGSV